MAAQSRTLLFVTGKLYSRDAALNIAGLEGVIHDMVKNGELTEAQVPTQNQLVLPEAMGGLQR